jgi:hypothetical protein
MVLDEDDWPYCPTCLMRDTVGSKRFYAVLVVVFWGFGAAIGFFTGNLGLAEGCTAFVALSVLVFFMAGKCI